MTFDGSLQLSQKNEFEKEADEETRHFNSDQNQPTNRKASYRIFLALGSITRKIRTKTRAPIQPG